LEVTMKRKLSQIAHRIAVRLQEPARPVPRLRWY
jgi:hypothetical protein